MKVSVRNLLFGYEDFTLRVDGLSFADGQVTSIVGPNGAGKSTFLKCLAWVLPTPRQSVFIDGRDLAGLRGKERARAVSYVPQEPSFTFNYTVLDFALTGRAAFIPPFSSPSLHDVEKAEAALHFVGLNGHARRPFLELSSGERRLVLIARALAQQSDILLLDEPTSFLDPRHEVETMELLHRLSGEKAKTIIVTLHNLEMAVKYSDSMVFMKDGLIVASGDPGSVLTEPLLESIYDIKMTILHVGEKILIVR